MTQEQRANLILGYDEDSVHEFWKSSAPKVIIRIHKQLVEKGLTKEEASDVIQGVWSTASEEYGN